MRNRVTRQVMERVKIVQAWYRKVQARHQTTRAVNFHANHSRQYRAAYFRHWALLARAVRHHRLRSLRKTMVALEVCSIRGTPRPMPFRRVRPPKPLGTH